MANFINTQNSFADGEISREFYAHDNLNGLGQLVNMDVMSGGGITRRAGLAEIAELDASVRLVPFSVGPNQEYLLAITDEHILVFAGATQIQDIASPWPTDAIASLQYAQRFGTMIFVHPDFQPRVLQKNADGFTLSLFNFSRNDSDLSVNIPFVKFDDTDGIEISVTANSAGNNYATFTTNRAFWTSDDIGGRFFVLNRQWTITSVTNTKCATAHTNGTFSLPAGPVTDWRQAAFSARRGWPVSITFHQDRLVFGGTRDYPAGVWLSQVGRHNNFDVGTGLDDQAIFITLLSAQRQQICTVVSADNLQILTTVGEWAIANKPLTPSSVDIKQHTSVGSVSSRYLPPQKIEGATVFVAASMRDIRELSLDELGENYNATDLCAYAKHLMQTPVDIAYNSTNRQLFVVMSSGNMAVLNKNTALGISAWSQYKTNGEFKSVAVSADKTFVVVARDDKYYLEQFSHSALCDAPDYKFAVAAAGIPLRGSGHNASRARIRKITARVSDTKSITINNVCAKLPDEIYTETNPGFTGDVSINTLGWTRQCVLWPWQITSCDAANITVMSVTMYGFYTV